MILLLRSNKMVHISNHIFDILNLRESSMAMYELFQLIFMILFMGHFFGCAFHYLSHVESYIGYENTWTDMKQLSNSGWLE